MDSVRTKGEITRTIRKLEDLDRFELQGAIDFLAAEKEEIEFEQQEYTSEYIDRVGVAKEWLTNIHISFQDLIK